MRVPALKELTHRRIMSSTLQVQKPLGITSSALHGNGPYLNNRRPHTNTLGVSRLHSLKPERETGTTIRSVVPALGSSQTCAETSAEQAGSRGLLTGESRYGSPEGEEDIGQTSLCGASEAPKTTLKQGAVYAATSGIRNSLKETGNSATEVALDSPASAWTDATRLVGSDNADVTILSEIGFSRPASSTCAADFTEQELVQAGNLLRLLRRRIEHDVRMKAKQMKPGSIPSDGAASSPPQRRPAEQTPVVEVTAHHIVRNARQAVGNNKLIITTPPSDICVGEVCGRKASRATVDLSSPLHRIRCSTSQRRCGKHDNQKPAEHSASYPAYPTSADIKDAVFVSPTNKSASQHVEKDVRSFSLCLSGESSFATVDSTSESVPHRRPVPSIVNVIQPELPKTLHAEHRPVSPFGTSVCPSAEASWCSAGTQDMNRETAREEAVQMRPGCTPLCRPHASSAVITARPERDAGIKGSCKKSEGRCVNGRSRARKVLAATSSQTSLRAERKTDNQEGMQGIRSATSDLTVAEGGGSLCEEDCASSAVEGGAVVDEDETERCPDCNRTFKCSAFEKHSKVCRKVFMTRRREFDVAKKRLAGLSEESGLFLGPVRRQTLNFRGQLAVVDAPPKPQSKWRKQSEQFRAAMRMTRLSDPAEIAEAQAILTEFSEAAATYKCPHCSRTFGRSEALEKHQRVCLRLFRSSAAGQKTNAPHVSASKVSATVGKRGTEKISTCGAGSIRRSQSRLRLGEVKSITSAGRSCGSWKKSCHAGTQPASSASSITGTTAGGAELTNISSSTSVERRGGTRRPEQRRNLHQRHASG